MTRPPCPVPRSAAALGALVLVAAALAPAALAQDPLVFVGTSVGGNTDPYFLVRPSTSSLVHQGGNLNTDNVTDAVFADDGARLYVGSSLQNAISVADTSGPVPVWSTLYPANGACYGVGLDKARKRLYTLAGPGGGNELVCLDVDTASPTYGQSLGATTTLSGPFRERWELSPSGNLAAVPHVFIGSLDLVDTNPASATYLQVIASSPIPSSGGFAFASDCAITADDQHVFVLWVGLGEQGLDCYHVPSGTWLDFDPSTPGVQWLSILQSVPNAIDLSADGSFLAISGQGSGGWAGRIDVDYGTPSSSVLVEFLAGQGLLPECNGVSLSPDSSMMAVTAIGPSVPASCIVLDTASGAIVADVALPGGGNLYTTAWQDLSPPVTTYCTAGTTSNGCTPTMSGTGTASASAPSGFTLSVSDIDGQRQGLIFYGVSGRAALPWGTSTSFLCVKAPTQRTPVQSTGGTAGACDGTLSLDWNAWIAAHPGALGSPFDAGDVVDAQAWVRDPPSPKTTMLSNGIEFVLAP